MWRFVLHENHTYRQYIPTRDSMQPHNNILLTSTLPSCDATVEPMQLMWVNYPCSSCVFYVANNQIFKVEFRTSREPYVPKVHPNSRNACSHTHTSVKLYPTMLLLDRCTCRKAVGALSVFILRSLCSRPLIAIKSTRWSFILHGGTIRTESTSQLVPACGHIHTSAKLYPAKLLNRCTCCG
jgi:hypothetical protein